jgi:hypothetical protein
MSPTTEQPSPHEHCLHPHFLDSSALGAILPWWCCVCGAVVKDGVQIGVEGPERLAYLRAYYMRHAIDPRV